MDGWMWKGEGGDYFSDAWTNSERERERERETDTQIPNARHAVETPQLHVPN